MVFVTPTRQWRRRNGSVLWCHDPQGTRAAQENALLLGTRFEQRLFVSLALSRIRDLPPGGVSAEDVEDRVEVEGGPLGPFRNLVMSHLQS
jgi:hypothetical protein